MAIATDIISQFKLSAKAVAKPIVRAAQPAIDSLAAGKASLSLNRRNLRIVRSDVWNDRLDKALDALPAPQFCTRDQYRKLLQGTEYRKMHALLTDSGKPRALVSVRKRADLWEPVAYQALSGFIAPATDPKSLGDAMNALGVHVQVTGIGPEAHELGAHHVWEYEASQVRLQDDIDGFLKENSPRQFRSIKRARKKCADMEVRVDGVGDIDWIVNKWTEMWADDPEMEKVCALDRLRFWKSLERNPAKSDRLTIHTITLLKEGKRVAGIAHSRIGGALMFQCTAREPEFDTFGVGVRVMDASIQWAAEQGFDILDLGGGGSYKKEWGMQPAHRNIVIFRPRLLDKLTLANQ